VNSSLRPSPLSPFAAPNTRWRPKFDRSHFFTLLPPNTRATVSHGRPSPHPNLQVPSPSTRRNVPRLSAPLQTFKPSNVRTLRRSFVTPLFSYSYELLFPQPLYFDNHPHCPRVSPLGYPDMQAFGPSNVPTLLFTKACSLFCISKKVNPFAIKQIQPLFAKHPGGGCLHYSSPASNLQIRHADAH